jgi:hypothetical protein
MVRNCQLRSDTIIIVAWGANIITDPIVCETITISAHTVRYKCCLHTVRSVISAPLCIAPLSGRARPSSPIGFFMTLIEFTAAMYGITSDEIIINSPGPKP